MMALFAYILFTYYENGDATVINDHICMHACPLRLDVLSIR